MNSAHQEIGVTVVRHVDRISSLSDDIITDMILSLLPTKDSVRTSVLSTRWKHLYASVPVLDFENISDLDVVSKVLSKLERVSKFRVVIDHAQVNSNCIVNWIETAASRSVQELDIRGFRVVCAATPHSLFTCETLVSLNLDVNFVSSVPDIVCLPKLKKLKMDGNGWKDSTDEESVRRLLSSCPVLESLVISRVVEDYRILNVSVPSLKFLRLIVPVTEVELVINCPNLEELSLSCYAMRRCSGDVLRSLKKCDIDTGLYVEMLQEYKLIELVRQVCKVRFLSLSWDSMQALLIHPCSLPTFENMSYLKLASHTGDGWRLLPSILDSSPRLETLDLVRGFFDIQNNFRNPFSAPEPVPVCLSFHLKVIRIGMFVGKEDEFKWVEYFLKNALVLEKMEICLSKSEDFEEEDYDPIDEEGEEGGEEGGEGEEVGERDEEQEEEETITQIDEDLERHFEIRKRLLKFQQSSEHCRIIFIPSYY